MLSIIYLSRKLHLAFHPEENLGCNEFNLLSIVSHERASADRLIQAWFGWLDMPKCRTAFIISVLASPLLPRSGLVPPRLTLSLQIESIHHSAIVFPPICSLYPAKTRSFSTDQRFNCVASHSPPNPPSPGRPGIGSERGASHSPPKPPSKIWPGVCWSRVQRQSLPRVLRL